MLERESVWFERHLRPHEGLPRPVRLAAFLATERSEHRAEDVSWIRERMDAYDPHSKTLARPRKSFAAREV
jgi:hypothetical protein